MSSFVHAGSLHKTFTVGVALLGFVVPVLGLSLPDSSSGYGRDRDAVAREANYLTELSFIPDLSVKDLEFAAHDFHVVDLGLGSSLEDVAPSSLIEFPRRGSFSQRFAAIARTDAIYVIYAGVISIVVLLTILIFWTRGVFVCVSIIVYLLSLATMTLTVKAVYVNNAYPFPKLVSALHFLFSGLACFVYLSYQRHVHGVVFSPPSLHQAKLILPVSFFFAVSIGAGNTALVYSNAGFVEMVASCGPLTTAMVCVVFGLGFDTRLVLPVLFVTSGMILCAWGEITFSWIGFIFAMVSTLTRSTRSVLQQKLLSTEGAGHALSPVELLAWMSIPSTVWMLTWSVFSEGTAPYTPLLGENGMKITWSVVLTCINAVCLNLSQFFVLQQLGAVGMIITGNLKGVLLLLGAVAIFGEIFTASQLLGFSIEMAGIFWYNRVDQEVRAETESGKEVDKTPLLSSQTAARVQ